MEERLPYKNCDCRMQLVQELQQRGEVTGWRQWTKYLVPLLNLLLMPFTGQSNQKPESKGGWVRQSVDVNLLAAEKAREYLRKEGDKGEQPVHTDIHGVTFLISCMKCTLLKMFR